MYDQALRNMDEGCKCSKKSGLQGEKEIVMVLMSKGRCTRVHLLPVLSSVCQFYGDNNIKWKQKSSHDEVNTSKMQVKKRAKSRQTSQVCPERYWIHPVYFEVKAL